MNAIRWRWYHGNELMISYYIQICLFIFLALSQVVDATFDDVVPLAQARMPEYFGKRNLFHGSVSVRFYNTSFDMHKNMHKLMYKAWF